MPTASVLPPGPILSASVTLSSAQVLAIFTTPVTIAPAPGAGLAIVPIFGVFNYTYKGTAYTDGGGSLQLVVGVSFNSFTTAGFWDQVVSKTEYLLVGSQAHNTSTSANSPLTVQQSAANPTLGNGTVTVTVAYMVVPVS